MKRTSRSSAPFLTLALLAASIGCATFFLSGCQFFGGPEKAATIDEQPNERRIGVIRSLGGLKTSNQGTHLLQLDSGDTVLLKSLMINLDDPMYSGKMVEVRGAMTYTTDNKQLMEVLNIDVVQDSPTTQEMKQLSWQTYDNASMGFSVKYRSDMKVSASGDSVNFEKKVESSTSGLMSGTEEVSGSQETEKAHVFTVKSSEVGSQSFLTWLKTEFPTLKSDSSSDLLVAGLTKSKVGSSSLDAVKHTEGSVVNYYVNGDKNYYIIHIDSGTDGSSLDDQNLFYEMLSSFTAGNPPSMSQELDEVDVGSSSSTSTTSSSTTTTTTTSTSTADKDDVPTKPTSTSSSSTTTTTTTPSTTSTTTTTKPPTPVTPPPTPPSSSSGSSTTTPSTTPASADSADVAISGFTKLESETFNFSMQFPKSWYYSGTTPTESGVVRHYDFGSKPLDEQEGSVSLDVMSGSVPSGTAVTVNGKNLVKVTSGDDVEYYYKGDGSKVYRVTGPASSASTLATMASSVEE